jgi:hypothetical protein
MSCIICNKLLHWHIGEHCNTTKPSPPPWLKLLTLVYPWTNSCVSQHKHILVHLGCHTITKPNKDLSISSFLVIDDNCTKICKLRAFGFYVTYPTFKLYVRIWIITIKHDLVVITPSNVCCKWFGFKLAHMHKYEICGSVSTTKWC